MDLQLHVQAVPTTTKVVSSNPAHGEVYLIQSYVIKFVSDVRQDGVFSGYFGFLRVLRFSPGTSVFSGYAGFLRVLRFSPGTPVSSTNKTDYHVIIEILLKVALNTVTLTLRFLLNTVTLTLRFLKNSEVYLRYLYIYQTTNEIVFYQPNVKDKLPSS